MWFKGTFLYFDFLCLFRDIFRKKHPEKWRNNSSFSFTTMLQHTGQFWSMISQQRIMRQHWINPHIFSFSLDWNQYWSDWFFFFCYSHQKREGRAENAFTKWLQGMFPTALQFLTDMFSCPSILFWSKYTLNDCTVFEFLINRVSPGIFWSYHVF